MYDVWAKVPTGGKEAWSRVAIGVTADDVETYRRTFVFPVHVEDHKEA